MLCASEYAQKKIERPRRSTQGGNDEEEDYKVRWNKESVSSVSKVVVDGQHSESGG